MSEHAADAAPTEFPTSPDDQEHAAITPMFRSRPIRKFPLPKSRAVTVDIIDLAESIPPEQRKDGGDIFIPRAVLVDGQAFFLPAESTVKVETAGHMATQITMTFMARRVRFGYADELTGPVAEVPGVEPAAAEAVLDAQMHYLAEIKVDPQAHARYLKLIEEIKAIVQARMEDQGDGADAPEVP
ncbi:hypothetical protein ACQP25_44920 (plasmid) [Microtetraspora malaysiensis]|uniref:hypothetical protein n=1 Tax=Microtetraspora malaysiensis TaxID=161358 RepID=UPI003D912750